MDDLREHKKEALCMAARLDQLAPWTTLPGAVAQALRTKQFDTVLGRIGFDEKGNVTGYGTYVWHVWQDGEFVPLKEAAPDGQAGGSG